MDPKQQDRTTLRWRRQLHFVIGGGLALLLASGLMAQETGSIAGRVLTADGEPVTDAVITVVATLTRSQADGEGRFELLEVPPGVQLLEVASLRHADGVERVAVVAGETIEVEILLMSRVHSEQIVVTGSPNRRGELDLASPINVLEGEELALRLEPTLGESLSQEAGISSTYFAPGASRPVIRGLGGDRVKMMENGIDTLDASSSSPDHAVAADPVFAERVEVLRGPATLLYGSNAIGGVVNVLDGRIPDVPSTESFTGTVDLRAGSVADERTAAVNLNGGGARIGWHLDFLSRETDDYEIPGRASLDADDEDAVSGVLPNSDIETVSGGIGLSYFFGERGFLGVAARGFDAEYGIPGGGEHHEEEDEEGAEEEEGLRIDMEQRRYDLEGAVTQPFGAFQGARFRFGLVDYEHAELEAPGVVGTEFFNDAWEGRAEFIQRSRGSRSGSFGIQARSRDLEAIGEEAFLPPSKAENVGLFTFQELGAGALSYQFGLRYEAQDTTVRDPELPDRDFDGLSASIGLVWQTSEDYSLGTSLARSVKMPSGEELYSEGLHFATSSFELGDPGLDEETALGLDITLRRVEGRVTGSFNLFYNDFSDYIFQAFTGDEVEGFPVVLWSQADAEFWGAELDLSILLAERAHSSWDLDLLADFVRAEFSDGGNLPRIPPRRFGVGVHYRGDRLRGGAEVRFVDDQDRIAENETATDGFTMVNGNVSYRFFFAQQFLDLILKGTNLTNEEARMHTSFVKDDVPLPGRNISLIARLGF
jgi:iron complex outermembrane receptor protein